MSRSREHFLFAVVRSSASRRSCVILGVVLGCLFVPDSPACACNVPVFRYALDYWPADKYEAIVFHQGPLGVKEQALLASFEKYVRAGAAANLEVRRVDVEKQTEESSRRLRGLPLGELPWMVLRYPAAVEIEDNAWAGPLRSVDPGLLDSPARREIARRILAGDSAVWVLLKSGQKEKDDRAAELVRKHLQHLQETLKLPELTDSAADRNFDSAGPPPRVAFSTIVLERGDPTEEKLVQLLLHTESDLADRTEPLLFPIFGRGRVLTTLVGAGITAENIQDACEFLAGACSCEVKRNNPGVDLLMTDPWKPLIQARQIPDPPSLPMIAQSRKKRPTVPKQAATPLAAWPSPLDDFPLAEKHDDSRMLHCGLAGAALVLLGAAAFLWRRSKRSSPQPHSSGDDAMNSTRLMGAAWIGLVCTLTLVHAKDEPASGLAVDAKERTVTISCTIAPRKLPNLKETYPIEVIATHPAPKGQKAHETVVTFDVKPSAVHKALEGLGLKPGKPVQGEGVPSGPEVKIFLEIPNPDGLPKKIAVESALVDKKSGKPVPRLKWYFTGSALKQPDPEKDDKVYGADLTGTLIALFPVTNDTVFQTNLTMKDEPLLKLDTNKQDLPKEGTHVKLIIQVQ